MGRSHESGWERQGTLWPAGTLFVGEPGSLVGNLRSESSTTALRRVRRDCIVAGMLHAGPGTTCKVAHRQWRSCTAQVRMERWPVRRRSGLGRGAHRRVRRRRRQRAVGRPPSRVGARRANGGSGRDGSGRGGGRGSDGDASMKDGVGCKGSAMARPRRWLGVYSTYIPYLCVTQSGSQWFGARCRTRRRRTPSGRRHGAGRARS